MEKDLLLRQQLVNHLKGGLAFMSIKKMLDKITFEQLSIQVNNLPYTFYQQFYHMYFAQKDIIDFCIDKNYKEPSWPKDYWTDKKGPESEEKWNVLVNAFFNEREEFCNYLLNYANDLHTILPNGNSQTLLREAILITEHNAYHTGQLLIILRLLHLHK
ncbi:DinB family protein [Zhouia sp. PK063]|uniref:DinB family protein n=1 Tax=Zhouia sp. PK063 TaxID=3373602 RepID=UPI0037B29CF8